MEHQTSQVPTASIFTTTEDIIRPPEIPVHHVTLIEVPHVNPISELPVCHWTRIKVRDLNLDLQRLRTFPWRIKSVEMVVTRHVRSLVWTNHRIQEEGEEEEDYIGEFLFTGPVNPVRTNTLSIWKTMR